MDKRKGPSPLSIVWQWAKEEHKEFYAAIVLAVIGVAGTMTAYFGMAALIRLLLAGGGSSEGVRYLGVYPCGICDQGDLLRSIDLHIPWRDLQDTAWRQKKNAGEAVESSAGNDPGYAVR